MPSKSKSKSTVTSSATATRNPFAQNRRSPSPHLLLYGAPLGNLHHQCQSGLWLPPPSSCKVTRDSTVRRSSHSKTSKSRPKLKVCTMAMPGTAQRSVHFHGPVLRASDLRAKAIWIRDNLEPNVARHGPLILAPDTVLDLNSFFYKLLALSQTDEHGRAPSITREALLESRIHRAIILIAGRGTRWPGRLVSLCDQLIEEWTSKFGTLDMIRPLLYEKGGRLEMLKEERDMGRHELMIKWMSDPSCMVSPLRALEHGHLEFKPGRWWIHPLFAFHDGIIDSPDPHGGIGADSDGAYAILLTAYDEVVAETPETFTYRCRTEDPGRFRLLGGILPPRTSVRILRSHTLHSVWSPPAGVRYDGLYHITKWSVKRPEEDADPIYEVTFERDLDQISMREVRLHPTSEEVDDYIEYKRLRGERHDYQESTRRDGLVGTETDIELSDEDQEEDDGKSVLTVKPVKMATLWDDVPSPFSVSKEETNPFRLTGGLSPSRLTPRYSFDPLIGGANPAPGGFDGTNSEPRGSVSSTKSNGSLPVLRTVLTRHYSMPTNAVLDRIRYCCDITDADVRHDQTSWLRRDSAHYSRNNSKTSSPRKGSVAMSTVSATSGRSDSIISYAPDHKTIHGLAKNVHDLKEVILRKVSVGSAFRDDLRSMEEIITRWQVESAETNGYVDHCLKSMEEDIKVMKEHRRFDWQGFAKEPRRTSTVEELSTLKRYQRRYEVRRAEEEREREEKEASGELVVVEEERLPGTRWCIADVLVLN